jgi:molecular chaperone DnaK
VTVIGGKDIPMPPYPAGAPIEVYYAYDVDQTIFVEVYDRTANCLLGSFEIDRIANFSDEEVIDRKRKIQGLEIN